MTNDKVAPLLGYRAPSHESHRAAVWTLAILSISTPFFGWPVIWILGHLVQLRSARQIFWVVLASFFACSLSAAACGVFGFHAAVVTRNKAARWTSLTGICIGVIFLVTIIAWLGVHLIA